MNGNKKLKALRRTNNKWTLIVEELVRVGTNYYRPQRTRISGSEGILSTVARLGGPDLLGAAEHAMSGTHSSYRISGGQLEPLHPHAQQETGHQGNSETTASATNTAESQALRQIKSLELRVRKLEAMMKKGISRAKRQSRVSEDNVDRENSEAPRRRETPASSQPSGRSGTDEPSAKQHAQEARESSSSAPPGFQESADSSRPNESASEPTSGADEAPASSGEALLTFPTSAAYSTALTDLVGEDSPFEEDDGSPDVHDGIYYMTSLTSGEDEVIGAIVVDLKAVVSQGGSLTMLDESARDEMVASGEPSDDVLDAMKEIANVQSRCFGSIKGNPHVRISELRRVEPSDAWLSSTAHRLTLLDRFGGRTILVSK